MAGTSGIDRTSSAGDVRDALGRLGAELELEHVDDGWRATVTAHGAEQLAAHGEDDAAAARAAWAEFVRRNGGTGES
jgi:hypothetical protein